jgi:hypothetical protein
MLDVALNMLYQKSSQPRRGIKTATPLTVTPLTVPTAPERVLHTKRKDRSYEQKAKRRQLVDASAGHLASLLPEYEITIIADNGKDRVKITMRPVKGLCG